MTRDDFEVWLENPVTQWVFRAVRAAAGLQKEHWDARAWGEGTADPALLIELRARADAYLALVETGYERWCELNGDEPQEEE